MQKNIKNEKPIKTIVFTMFFKGPGFQKPRIFINCSLKNLSENRSPFFIHFYALFDSNLDEKLDYFGALGAPKGHEWH